ncbi:hypothetical protein Y032_0255g336 [Ancylostoma ceylanicum]|uniref:Uncharacterized protein n=1 Tax=Ancylostoma ceylanicum TaxID=53326 RepID=A0A016SC48_9BILA|nr:hypothetical protein Y032_0255g336 [Ancylostoma ceylanicum]
MLALVVYCCVALEFSADDRSRQPEPACGTPVSLPKRPRVVPPLVYGLLELAVCRQARYFSIANCPSCTLFAEHKWKPFLRAEHPSCSNCEYKDDLAYPNRALAQCSFCLPGTGQSLLYHRILPIWPDAAYQRKGTPNGQVNEDQHRGRYLLTAAPTVVTTSESQIVTSSTLSEANGMTESPLQCTMLQWTPSSQLTFHMSDYIPMCSCVNSSLEELLAKYNDFPEEMAQFRKGQSVSEPRDLNNDVE